MVVLGEILATGDGRFSTPQADQGLALGFKFSLADLTSRAKDCSLEGALSLEGVDLAVRILVITCWFEILKGVPRICEVSSNDIRSSSSKWAALSGVVELIGALTWKPSAARRWGAVGVAAISLESIQLVGAEQLTDTWS
jgi:hypothetical protein